MVSPFIQAGCLASTLIMLSVLMFLHYGFPRSYPFAFTLNELIFILSWFYLSLSYIFTAIIANWVCSTRGNSYRRRRRLHARFIRYGRRNNRYFRHLAVQGFCWFKLFPALPYECAFAFGPKILPRTLYYLHKNLSFYSQRDLFKHARFTNNHVTFDPFYFDGLKSFLSTGSRFFGVVQSIIDTASAVNASQLGNAAATTIFRNAYENSIKVHTALSNKQRKLLENELDFEVVFTKEKTVVSDHQILMAMREIIRTAFDRAFHILQTEVSTLIVGSSYREFNDYSSNSLIHYHFHNSEAKDETRIQIKFLEHLVKKIREKLRKRTSVVNGEKKEVSLSKRLDSFEETLKLCRETGGYPDIFRTKPDGLYEKLVLEDSFYNMQPNDYYDLFNRTNASVAYGYGLLPYELLFPDMAPNPFYRFFRAGDMSVITFRGYANTYSHKTEAWETLLKRPVMNFPDYALVTEIVARVGPFAIFTITKTNKGSDEIVREIALPVKQQYVKLLDVPASINVSSGSRKEKLKYFSVRAQEYFDTLNYCLAIDPKSCSFQNTLTFVRRQAGGVCLATKELMAPWALQSKDYYRFALTVWLHARLTIMDLETFSSLDFTQRKWKVRQFFDSTCRILFALGCGITFILSWLKSEDLVDKLVLFPDDHLIQREKIIIANPKKLKHHIVLPPAEEKSVILCPICARLENKLGLQVVKCEHKDYAVDFSMSQSELDTFKTRLIDSDHEASKYQQVMQQAADNLPKAAFSHKVRLHYILGGPGCGKSYIITKLADEFDLIYAPFTKLRADYQHVKRDDQEINFEFKTVHRAMLERNRSAIYIDEFTSLPFEFIKCVAYLCSAEDVFLVGDEKQSRVRSHEGQYIFDYIDPELLPKHTLLRNFRNGQDVVNLVNKRFKSEMQCMSNLDKTITVLKKGDKIPPPITKFASNDTHKESGWKCQETNCKHHSKPATGKWNSCLSGHGFHGEAGARCHACDPQLVKGSYAEMCFSKKGCEDAGIDQNCTVRSFQGSTFTNVILHLNDAGTESAMSENLKLVALTRHTHNLVIVHDDTSEAHDWLRDVYLEYNDGQDIKYGYKMDENHIHLHQPATVAPPLDYEQKRINNLVQREFIEVDPLNHSLPVPDKPTRFSHFVHFLVFFKSVIIFRLLIEYANLSWVVEQSTKLDVNIPKLVQFQIIGWYGIFMTLWKIMLVHKTHEYIFNYLNYKNFDFYYMLITGACFGHSFFKPDYDDRLWYADVLTLLWVVSKIRFFMNNLSVLHNNINFYWVAFGFALQVQFLLVTTGYASLCYLIETNPYFYCLWFLIRYKEFSFTFNGLYNYNLKPILRFSTLYEKNGIISKFDGFDYVTKPFRDLSVNPQYIDYVFHYLNAWFPVKLIKPELEPSLKIPKLQSAKDSHLLDDTLIPTAATIDTMNSFNEVGGSLGLNDFTNGVLNEDFLNPTNPRGHPQTMFAKYFQRFVGTGNVYDAKSPFQYLSVMSKRYLNKKRSAPKPFGDEAKQLAQLMVNKFFKEHMQEVELDENRVGEIVDSWFESAASKKYMNQFKGYDNTDVHTIRFHIKTIFKPNTSKNGDAYKAPQGISAFNKDMQIFFGPAARIINDLVLSSLKDHVVYDNKMTPEEVKNKLNLLMELNDFPALNGVTDFEMYDSQQDQFTQCIEREFLMQLGVRQDFIDHYYSFRSKNTIIGGNMKGRMGFEKTSGEPFTLLMNTVLSAVMTNFLLRGEGPCVLAIKGDDGFKRQANLKMHDQNYLMVSQYTNLKMKVQISNEAEFCGYVIKDGRFIDNHLRKLHKVLSHRFRDYKHFCEYQDSLRNYIDENERDMETYGQDFAPMTAEAMGCDVETARSAYDCLKAYSHIDEETFNTMFTFKKSEPVSITALDYVPTVMVN